MDSGSTKQNTEAIKRIRILFLAWGYSVHAQRRIGIFADDPLFDVKVVSTYDYQIPGAATILLSAAKKGRWIFNHDRTLLGKILFPLTVICKFFRELVDLVRDYIILKKTLDTKNPDIIFLQTLLYPSYLVLLIRRSIPVIITFWNGDVTWWAEWTGIERLMKKQIVIHGVHRAAAITVNSETAFNACRNYGKSADSIHLIRYPGVDLSRFYPIEKTLARRYLGMESERIVFWPRGTGEYLNFDTLVTASQIVLMKYNDLHFIVVSPNKTNNFSIQEDLEKKGLGKYFSFFDTIPFEDMPFYYSAADMMISISSNDSLPNTMLEAMACGCPVVMGDIPQIRGWVADAENGYLCGVKDADKLATCIQKIFENAEHRNERFIQKNLDMVAREVDSVKMSARIKNLVMEISSKSKETQK
jgi:glycosyltransferase involved in cell wall biosynthesis